MVMFTFCKLTILEVKLTVRLRCKGKEEKVKMVMKTKTWNAIRMTWNWYLHNKRKAKKA